MALRMVMLYSTECLAVKKHISKMNVAEMRVLRWICDKIRRDKIRNVTDSKDDRGNSY